MNTQPTVRVTEGRSERRVYRRPWGLEIQLWHLAETITVPETAGSMSLSSLLTEAGVAGDFVAGGEGRAADDDRTLENLELKFSPGESKS